ncbi:MAG: DUF6326 family protein [Cyclobacteriaceae bacterium]
MKNTKVLLSTIWIFLTVNFIFCDVFTLMYSEDLQQILNGKAGEIELTQEFLLLFAIIMEISMMMIVLSRLLTYKLNRILNLIFGLILVLVQLGSLLADDNSLHYIFFSIIEVTALLCIVWLAWHWKNNQVQSENKPIMQSYA